MTKAIIIAAGLGSRLKPYTNNVPRTLLKINNKTILDRHLQIFKSLNVKNINMVVGYKKEKFQNEDLNYIENKSYKNNNILESLFYAKSLMKDNCLISYSDIIFKKVVKKLLKSKNSISVLVDTNWKKIIKVEQCIYFSGRKCF